MSAKFNITCPAPTDTGDTIQLAHGGGGRLTRELIESVFYPAFSNPALDARHDSAVLELDGARLAVTTDAFVVNPLFFPGGDIGKLAICGTVNDLAMSGAQPRALSASFILEEGLSRKTLVNVVASMRATVEEAGVVIAAGDTKVVNKGKGDGMFISTTGLGIVRRGVEIRPRAVRPGDAIIVSGDLGRHGIAVLSVREGLAFDEAPNSDCACLHALVAAMLDAAPEIHCLRDLTRGGLASAVNEIARDASVGIELDETLIPVSEPVRGACELLGLDPLYVANEGRLVAFVPAASADILVNVMRKNPQGTDAGIIGQVTSDHRGVVVIESSIGGSRILDLLSGEQLPRIC